MDLNHDYIEHEPFLLAGAKERLQMCKCAILAMGDLGYTDPSLPDIREFVGAYTDAETGELLVQRIHEILLVGRLARAEEIISIKVVSEEGADHFQVRLDLAFGSEVLDVPTVF